MSYQSRTSQQVGFRYQNFQVLKDEAIGIGAYGAVYKAKCDQLSCAAKILHRTILDPTDPGASAIMRRFQQECEFLSSIRHPNIVQYLGMTVDPESGLPVLLMELLDESLTKMLERSQKPLAYCVQVNLCHDIAMAIAYLHSNGIIHRDLSSNNVLIVAKSRAKVTDFGMSTLAGTAPNRLSLTPMTVCPGTQVYMAPEALREPPRYSEKLDCFSEGVIMIQVCTRLWPDPGPRTKSVQFPGSPTGVIEVPVIETERRQNHIDMVGPSHPILPIALDCLHYQEEYRPSSKELCRRVAELKRTREYKANVDEVEKEQNNITELERQIGEMQLREATVQQLCDEIQQLSHRSEILKQNDIAEMERLTGFKDTSGYRSRSSKQQPDRQEQRDSSIRNSGEDRAGEFDWSWPSRYRAPTMLREQNDTAQLGIVTGPRASLGYREPTTVEWEQRYMAHPARVIPTVPSMPMLQWKENEATDPRSSVQIRQQIEQAQAEYANVEPERLTGRRVKVRNIRWAETSEREPTEPERVTGVRETIKHQSQIPQEQCTTAEVVEHNHGRKGISFYRTSIIILL